jgi:hypothetical protein
MTLGQVVFCISHWFIKVAKDSTYFYVKSSDDKTVTRKSNDFLGARRMFKQNI